MKHHIFQRIILILAAACFLLLSGCGRQTENAQKFPPGHEVYAAAQVIAADNRTMGTIMWRSRFAMENPTVEYRKAEGGDIRSVNPGTINAHKENSGSQVWIYTAGLTGMEPETAYEYRIRDGKYNSSWYAMKTDGGGDFTALVFPDSQSSDYTVWQNTAQSAWKAHPEAAFFINMGDLVDNGEDSHQWDSWFSAVSGMIDRIPVAPVMGNHETYSEQWQVKWPEDYLAAFSLPDNGDKRWPGQFYSFDYGDVHFAVLNTQIDELEPFRPGLLEAQKLWLADDLSRTDKKWKVVLMHKDPLQYGIAGRPERTVGFSQEGTEFMPIFDRYHVDAVLSAHLHTYRRRGHIRDFKRDETGPLYILTGVAGDVRYPNLWLPHPLDEYIAPQPDTDDYLTMESSERSLTFIAWLPSGEKIDEVTLEK